MGHIDATPGAGYRAGTRNRSLNNRRGLIDGAGAARGPLRGLPLLALGILALATPVVLHGQPLVTPTLRAALEMMITLFAFAGAWLLRADFACTHRLREFSLLVAALALGLINLATAALPAALNLHPGNYFAVARVWGGLFVAVLFAVAAYAPPDWMVTPRRHPLATTAGVGLAGLLIAGLGGLLGGTGAAQPTLATALGHPLLIVLVVAATALLAYATLGFATRQRGDADTGAGVFAASMVLMAGGGFSNLLAHSLAPGRIDSGDALRALGVGLILVGAVARERHVRARMSKATALAERRRVARDLHDGIAQDLAFIAAHGPRFAAELGDDHPVVVAARRALEISRSTISELSDPCGATVCESLEAVAHELGERFEISIAVNTQLDRDLARPEHENVTRIVREAIANAARHGGARHVIVSLRHTETGTALRVVDDGRGILGADLVPAPEGFGLRSMRERAAALGGQLNVRQPRRGGTELEVVLP